MCHGQLAQLRDRITDIRQAGAELLVVDPHESWSAQHFLDDIGLPSSAVGYPLLMDPSQHVSATYGVAMQMRIHTEISNRPATFIIGRNGIIRSAHRAESFSDRPGPEVILEELEQLSR